MFFATDNQFELARFGSVTGLKLPKFADEIVAIGRLHLGFVSGRDDAGNLKITWLVEQSVPSTQTHLALDSSLCGTAPDGYGSQWRWYVEVVTDVNGAKTSALVLAA